MEVQEMVPNLNTRIDKDPFAKEKFDFLFDEEMMESRLDEDQVHDMYCNKVMAFVNACTYAEFNGSPVIGTTKTKVAFESDLRNMTLKSIYESFDFVRAVSDSGDSYFFSKGVANV